MLEGLMSKAATESWESKQLRSGKWTEGWERQCMKD
jgi:hypothetical protein